MKIKKQGLAGAALHPKAVFNRLRAGYHIILERRRREAEEERRRNFGIPEITYYQQILPQPQYQYPQPQTGRDRFVEKERIVEKIIEKKLAEKEGEIAGLQIKTGQVEIKGGEMMQIPEGFDIPTESGEGKEFSFLIEEKDGDLANVNISYPLIPSNPERGDTIFAYVTIKWDPQKEQVIYDVVEPEISQRDFEIIETIKRKLEELLDVDFLKLGPIKAQDILRGEIEKMLAEIEYLGTEEKTIITYYIERDIIGYGKLEPLMNDPNIEDISCDGVGIPLYIYHRDPKLGSIRSNIIFATHEELNDFVVRLAQKSKKTITIAEPLLDASLPDGSRVQATLGTDIARKGSNFTIRKFTEKPLTPTHMLLYRTLDSTQLAYLWLVIENGQSVLVSGGTATGKTSLLNALSLFIRPNLKIVSIEDTPELRLPHPHWIPHVARTPVSIKRKVGDVTLFDLLKSSLRQRPDYIIVGEVRGKEAFVLFQQIATGHPGISTIHAASLPQLVDRLTTPPISLPPTLLENINVIVFLVLSRFKGKYVRRADSVVEVVGIRNNMPVTRPVFRWKASEDFFEIGQKSVILEQLAKRLGMTVGGIRDEMVRRKRILEWMAENSIMDYRDVARVISMYYSDPNRVMALISQAPEEAGAEAQ